MADNSVTASCPPQLKIRKYIQGIACAVLLILSFPKFNFWILAWFGFVPLFFALQNKTKLKAFLISYFTGVIFWSGIVYWLVHVTCLGLILLVLYLALYFGVFGLIISFTRLRVYAFTRLLFIPALWVLLEYLRSHIFTGFGWGLLGYSQYLNLPVIQIAGIAGVWGVSFLVMMVNVLIFSILDPRSSILAKKQRPISSFIVYALAVVLLFLSLGYGLFKLYLSPITYHLSPIRISVIQGNIPQSIKWQKNAKDEIWQQYLSLSRKALKDSPELIIWPEAALPGIPQTDLDLKHNLRTLARNAGIPFLIGTVSLDGNNYYNSAVLISKQGEFIQRYDKLHLVPFGEYIPFKGIFSFLETVVPIGDFIPGKEHTVFLLDETNRLKGSRQQAVRFSVLVCFEDLFPEISRQFVKKGADFLVNITNDAWFCDTSSPYQHLSASVFRAVENGVYLVRAANTGISGFIEPGGRVCPVIDDISRRQTFISGYRTGNILSVFKKNTFYSQWGDWFVLVCLIIVIYGVIGERFPAKAGFRHRRKKG